MKCADCLIGESKALNHAERRKVKRACRTPGCENSAARDRRKKPHSRKKT